MSEFAYTESTDSGKLIHIPKLVITGGPCSGKTTGMAKLQTTLRGLGYRVYIATEAATMYFLAGVAFSDLANPDLSTMFQKTVLNAQMQCENNLDRYARATGEKSIILCDRGAMDGRAYIDSDTFADVLADANLNLSTANAGRYDAVFHLVTAADGAERHYSLDNNETRTESVEYAKLIDKKTQSAWAGHPKHFIIGNSGFSFEGKMDVLVSTMLQCLGHSEGSADGSTQANVVSDTSVYHFELNEFIEENISSMDDTKIFHIEKVAQYVHSLLC